MLLRKENSSARLLLAVMCDYDAMKCKYSSIKYSLKCLKAPLRNGFRILKNSGDNVCCSVPFYRSRYKQVLYRIAALEGFLQKSQEGLQVYFKRTPPWMFCWEVSRNFKSSYFCHTSMEDASENSNSQWNTNGRLWIDE